MDHLPTRFLTILPALAALCFGARANDIQVSNATLTGNDGITGTCFIEFDLSWQNSWRGGGANNNDAAWVFAKFRTSAGVWSHVRLGNTGHVAPSGSQIDLGLLTPGAAFNATTNPVLGTFIRRSAEGTGTFTATGVQLRWPYGAQGLSFNDIVEVRVFAIEMVLVNGGAFAAGSGGSAPNEFTLTTISTANASTAPSGTGMLGGQAGGHPTGSSTGGNAAYPNGFNAYYCMKYELSQQQYVDFLNTLTRNQQKTRIGTTPPLIPGVTSVTNRFVMSNSSTIQFRNGIRCDATIPANEPITFYCDGNSNGIGGEANDGQWRACNFLNWPDLGAYLEWSCLRPMSELEFEKACRGGLPAVANEFAWGTTGIASGSYALSQGGTTASFILLNFSTSAGNASYATTGLSGPVRVGIFAGTPGSTGRVTAGAGAPGIMELSGSLSEFVVDLFNIGTNYTGLHGDGALRSDGAHETAFWPDNSVGNGATIRGGGFSTSAAQLRTSDRSNILSTGWENRANVFGGRGVRTAP